MLKLHGTLPVLSSSTSFSYLATVTTNPDLPFDQRQGYAFMTSGGLYPLGFRAILRKKTDSPFPSSETDIFEITEDYDYLTDGDIVRLDPHSGSMRCLYRKTSPNNTILLTERCDHYCLMCSQPPKAANDTWLLDEAFALINLIPSETRNIGFSGGEPTLYGMRFIELPNYETAAAVNPQRHH